MANLTAGTARISSRGWTYPLAMVTTVLLVLASLALAYRGMTPEGSTADDLVTTPTSDASQAALPGGLAVLLPDANRQVAVILSDPDRKTLHIHISDIQLSGDRQLVLWEIAPNGQLRGLGSVSDGTVLSFPSSGLTEGARLIVTLEQEGSEIPDLPGGPVLVAGSLNPVN